MTSAAAAMGRAWGIRRVVEALLLLQGGLTWAEARTRVGGPEGTAMQSRLCGAIAAVLLNLRCSLANVKEPAMGVCPAHVRAELILGMNKAS